MDADELARSVAKDLGADVAKSTEAAIRGEGSRSWSDAAAIGGFVVEVCRFAWEIYKDTKSKPELLARLQAMLTKPANLSEAKAKVIVDGVVDRITAGSA